MSLSSYKYVFFCIVDRNLKWVCVGLDDCWFKWVVDEWRLNCFGWEVLFNLNFRNIECGDILIVIVVNIYV